MRFVCRSCFGTGARPSSIPIRVSFCPGCVATDQFPGSTSAFSLRFEASPLPQPMLTHMIRSNPIRQDTTTTMMTVISPRRDIATTGTISNSSTVLAPHRTVSSTRMFSPLLLLSVLLILPSLVNTLPHFLLTTTRPKCINVHGTKATTFNIEYNALGS